MIEQTSSFGQLDLELELKKRLDRYFSPAIDTRLSAPQNLRESISYSLLAPGKRIRPRLAIESAKLHDLSKPSALAVGLAIEMIHCFSLIHDDLPCMDNDDFRRGKPSNHKKFGEALALLAGDALMPVAFETFLEAAPEVSPLAFQKAMSRFMEAIGPRGVMGGQAEEMLLSENSKFEQLKKMHLQKTGVLFEASLLIPAELSSWNPNSQQGKALQFFATQLGLGFQVADDFEDQDQDLESDAPRSILNFISKSEAMEKTKSQLLKANEQMLSAFGESAAALVGINQEIIKRLR